jgi:pantothenate kinase
MKQCLNDIQHKKIKKPDFTSKEGRGMLAYLLQKEFEYILNIDKDAETPFFKRVKDDFVQRFTKRIIENPTKRIMIGICGESASGKTTICEHIKKTVDKYSLPVEIISTDNYFNDISKLIKEYGGFDNFLESGYDLDAPSNFMTDQLKEDLKMLADGQDVMTPQYLINGSGVNIPKSLPAKSQKIIAVEGLAAM